MKEEQIIEVLNELVRLKVLGKGETLRIIQDYRYATEKNELHKS